MKNRVGGTNVTNNPIEHVQNSAQNTNVTKNLTERFQNSARGTNISIIQSTFKTMRKTLT